MATIESLRSQVAAIRAQVNESRAARQWSMVLEEGEELSDEMLAQIQEHDTVCIRRFPKGFMGEAESNHSQVMSCWLKQPGGRLEPHVVREYGVDIGKV